MDFDATIEELRDAAEDFNKVVQPLDENDQPCPIETDPSVGKDELIQKLTEASQIIEPTDKIKRTTRLILSKLFNENRVTKEYGLKKDDGVDGRGKKNRPYSRAELFAQIMRTNPPLTMNEIAEKMTKEYGDGNIKEAKYQCNLYMRVLKAFHMAEKRGLHYFFKGGIVKETKESKNAGQKK